MCYWTSTDLWMFGLGELPWLHLGWGKSTEVCQDTSYSLKFQDATKTQNWDPRFWNVWKIPISFRVSFPSTTKIRTHAPPMMLIFRTARMENQQRIKILACRQPTGCRAQNLIFKETHKNSAWEASKCQSMPRPNVSMEYRWSLASSLQAWERNPESSKTTTVLQVWKTVRTLRAVSNRFVLWDWLVMFVTESTYWVEYKPLWVMKWFGGICGP